MNCLTYEQSTLRNESRAALVSLLQLTEGSAVCLDGPGDHNYSYVHLSEWGALIYPTCVIVELSLYFSDHLSHYGTQACTKISVKNQHSITLEPRGALSENFAENSVNIFMLKFLNSIVYNANSFSIFLTLFLANLVSKLQIVQFKQVTDHTDETPSSAISLNLEPCPQAVIMYHHDGLVYERNKRNDASVCHWHGDIFECFTVWPVTSKLRNQVKTN